MHVHESDTTYVYTFPPLTFKHCNHLSCNEWRSLDGFLLGGFGSSTGTFPFEVWLGSKSSISSKSLNEGGGFKTGDALVSLHFPMWS